MRDTHTRVSAWARFSVLSVLVAAGAASPRAGSGATDRGRQAGQRSVSGVRQVAASALGAQTTPAAVAGRWTMTINFTDGARAAGLEVTVKGRAIGGKFVAAFAGGDVPIEGEIEDGKLTFSASTSGGPHPGIQLDFSATRNADGTLSGTLSAPFGDFSWTAERLD